MFFIFFYQPVSFYSALFPSRVPYFSPVPNNPCSYQPTSVPVFPAPLSILGVSGVESLGNNMRTSLTKASTFPSSGVALEKEEVA